MPSRLLSSLAASVSLTVLAALGVAIAPAADAAPQDAATASVTGFFDRFASEVLPQIASSTSLAQQLPTVAVTPAGSVGLRTAFSGALASGGQLGAARSQATLGDLVGYLDGADGGGWDFTASRPSDNAVTLRFTRTVTDPDAGLDVRDKAGTLSLSTGGGITVTGTLTGSFTFVYDPATAQTSLTKPSMTIATTADLPDGKDLLAGLGILGVKVVGAAGTADYHLDSTVTTAWANPDNDAAGSLSFDNPATAADGDGELSAAGAGTGLVTATRTGSVDGHLVAVPRDKGLVAGLPSVGGTVDVTSTGTGTFEAPAVTAVVDDAAKPFLTLTPRDLAAGLSQAASAVIGVQNAQDGQLPLMRGTLANAVDAVGGIKAFLAQQVPDADTSDKTPGQPKFASLQDMLAALDSAAYPGSGWTIDVLGGDDAAAYDSAQRRVGFTVRTTRSAKNLELNVLGAPTTGTGTYSATGLTATGVDLDGPSGTAGPDLVGRHVTAGASTGTIAKVDSASALTLDASGWVGGQPADGTSFSIAAADPKTGAPELADSLLKIAGIKTANADLSTATISPDVVTTLPMALDLSAPRTYQDASGATVQDCDPSAANAPCPFQQVDAASGLGRVITSLPLAADRVMLRQSPRDLLVADAAVSSPVQIKATSGFLALSIGGTVGLTVPSGQHLQAVKLTDTGDIPVPAFVEKVRQQAVSKDAPAVFTQTLGGTVSAALDVKVDDAPDAFGTGKSSTPLTVTGTVAALADGIDDGDLTVTAANPGQAVLLKALNFDSENPTSLFGGLQAAFQGAGSNLTTMTGGGLDTPIPLVGASVGQLIGAGASGAGGVTYEQLPGTAATSATPAVPATTKLTDPGSKFTQAFVGRQIVVGSTSATIVAQDGTSLALAPQLKTAPVDATPYLVENELLGAVHRLTAATPATLQEALATAQASLGNGSTIGFGLQGAAGSERLRLDLTWKRSYAVSRPVSLTFGDGAQQLVGVDAGGELSVEASGTVKLRLLLPLNSNALKSPLTNTLVDKSGTSLDFGVKVAADDAHLAATLGPVNLGLGTAADPGSVKAGLGVRATSAAAGTTPSITSFFGGGFGVAVTNGGACTDKTLVLCADFPTYVNGAAAAPKADDNHFTVAATLGSGDLRSTFTGTSLKVTPPPVLASLLAGTPFKFGSFTEGLQQYLFYAETALRTASNNGEMPVIGKDLQAGADFMGTARKKLDGFLEKYGDPTNVGDAKKLLTTQLADRLGVVVDGSDGVTLDLTCSGTSTTTTNPLNPPSVAPVATATGATAADTTQYRYSVVSTFTDSAGKTVDSVPSAATSTGTNPGVRNASTLSGTKYNTVTWRRAAGATGYRVLRSTLSGTTWSTPTPVGTTKSLATFRDKGVPLPVTNPPAPAYVASTVAPQIPAAGPCTDDLPTTRVEGLTIALTMGQGDVSGSDGCEDSKTRGACLGGKLPVDLGLPGLSLKTGDSGSVSGKVGWALDVKIGMSRSKGFYVDTSDDDEFEVGASLKLDKAAAGPDLKAQLAIIDVGVTKRTDNPEFVGHFGIDIKGTGGVLTLAELARTSIAKAITVSVDAKVDVDWHLEGTADAALPGISTNLRLLWGWGARSGQPAGTPASSTTGLSVKFNNVTLDTGAFFGKALKPYLQQVVDATKPLQPIIDTIFTPMPVISDLSKAAGGKEVTIATLADTFNTVPGGAKIQPFLSAIRTVKKLAAGVSCDASTTTCGIDVGSFDLSPTTVATTRANPATAKQLVGTTAPVVTASQKLVDTDSSKQLGAPGTLKDKVGRGLPAGLSIPVMSKPSLLFDLISGGDIPLVEFDSGPLQLGFQFQKSFGPIYAPPPVMMVIGGGASVTMRVAAGFDTYGIRKAAEGGRAVQVLDSLYFKTVDDDGTPIPVVQFTGYLEAGASVSLGVLQIGVIGGIKLTVGFYWNDPTNDGKFRLIEFGTTAARNPICLFNMGGELSLYVKVFVEIGFSPFSVSFDFTLVNLKLLDFALKPDCSPPPPRLGGVSGKALYVFAGKLGGSGPRGDKAWNADGANETWVVRQVPAYADDAGKHPAAVELRGLGITESFDDPDGTAIDTVVLDGRGYAGNLSVTFTGGSPPNGDDKLTAFTKKAVVFTGSGADVIRTGEGESWVDSGAGDDTVTTLDRTDLSKPLYVGQAHVAGGPGNDTITVGNGNDTVSGDGALGSTETSVSTKPLTGDAAAANGVVSGTGLSDSGTWDAATVSSTGDGNDQIAAGLGQVRLSGNGGDDTIGTANDSVLADAVGVKAGTTGGSKDSEALYRAHASTLVGGAGSDTLKSGSADDKLYTGSHDDIGQDGAGAGDAKGDKNTVDTGAGSDTVYGSNGQDFVTTASSAAQHATVFGGDQADVLAGGLGSDELYGGPGDDYVIAAPATVGAPGSASDVLGGARNVRVLPGAGSSPKKLVGGTGSDRIYGSDGTSEIFGDTTKDGCTAQSSPVSDLPGESPTSDDGNDLVQGGNGVDVVNAGGGDDWVYASGASDRVCGNAGDDHLYGGDDADLVQGGSGGDQAYGDAGDDQVYGHAGADALYGGAGADRLQGNQGGDWVDGGGEADVLLGGTSKAGRADGSDVLLGGGGADVVVGDDAQSDVLADSPYPTDLGSSDAAVGGGDYLGGGDDADRLLGGVGDDTVAGGAGDDSAEGGPGADRVSGEDGDDDLVGGSSEVATPAGGASPTGVGRPDAGDTVSGGGGQDVVLADNGTVSRTTASGTMSSLLTNGVSSPLASPLTVNRVTTPRTTTVLDLGESPTAGTSGADRVDGGAGNDVLLGQGGNDDTDGGADADYVEGGQGADLVRGGSGDDDVVGGSSSTTSTGVGQPDTADAVYGGSGNDLALGDNGLVTRVLSGRDWRTNRADATGAGLVPGRAVTLLDLNSATPLTATAGHSGADALSGQDGVDELLGQDGDDRISGGGDDDYLEGDGGADALHGDAPLTADELVTAPASATAWSTPAVDAAASKEGQDDVVGGWAAARMRDGADTVHGDGGDDFVVADDGAVARSVVDGKDRVYTQRFAPGGPGDTKVRVAGGDAVSTRFCPVSGSGATATCDTAGAWGADTVSGDDGRDVLYGQDGNDTVWGGAGDDDVYGELGADTLYGQAGEDAILGDRGGIQDRYEDGSRSVVTSLNSPPAVSWTSRRKGSVTREADLAHDVNGTDLVGSATSTPMPLDGTTYGDADRIRGGDGRDSLHGGAGDDLVNGDAGGDSVFGDRGADALWGGVGRTCATTDTDCQADPGKDGEFVDHLAGGKDADVLDWRPRGSYGTGPALTGRTCTTGAAPATTQKGDTADPCSWFEMTDRANDDPAVPATLADNQHHQGVDWIYGGWDRDVMQADLSENGPHPGDRLMDWNGVYNLYSHCNAAYGGFTDVRNHSPAVQSFLQSWADGNGAGRPAGSGRAADSATPGTSAYDELALTTTGDAKDHGTGSPYPGSPGHFDADACAGP
ncbi:hypothetical protein GCM10027596_15790 [Nocardioides korecus]